MKCETCLNLLEEYLDGELVRDDANTVEAHLITCVGCSAEFSALTSEQELFARYDREIEVPASLWSSVATEIMPMPGVAQTKSEAGLFARFLSIFQLPSVSFAGAVAVLLLALLAGAIYVDMKQSAPEKLNAGERTPQPVKSVIPEQKQKAEKEPEEQRVAINSGDEKHTLKLPKRVQVANLSAQKKSSQFNESDVLSSDLGSDLEDQDTAKHLEQTRNLLRSIRNTNLTDADDDVDVTYDKELSRRLLVENIVLRRDAEMSAKYPTKSLLTELEPFLIDIANLPDRAKPEDVRQIKERVVKTEIVAALSDYQGRAADNR
jgi:hypothetical protein